MKTPIGLPLVPRAAALLAVCSAVLHGSSLPHAPNVWLAGLMVAMLAGCLYCAYELWTRDTVRSWVLVAVMNLAMVGVHLPMTGLHHHGGLPAGPVVSSTTMQWATLVAVIEVLLAATVLFVRTRALAPIVAATCQSGDHDSAEFSEGAATTRRPVGRDVDRLPEPG